MKVDREYTNGLGMKFVLIPPGEFTMGSTAEEILESLQFVGNQHWGECVRSEGPRHRVILTQPIYLGMHEVAQQDFEKVMGRNPAAFAKTGYDQPTAAKVAGLDTSRHPVEGVSWIDAAEFCNKLSEQEKLLPNYNRSGDQVTMQPGDGYRMPTEAEWEFACRAGSTSKFWTGDRESDLQQAAWIGANADGRTHPVGELKANPWGLFDIHGNVAEWMQDAWDRDYYAMFAAQPALNPRGAEVSNAQRVHRGGDWVSLGCFASSSARGALDPSRLWFTVGVRLVLPVEAAKASPRP